MIALVPAMLVALAVATSLSRPGPPTSSGIGLRRRAASVGIAGVVMTGVGLATGLMAWSVRAVVLAGLAAAVVGLGGRLLSARQRAARAARRGDQVLLACAAIAGDLSAGLPPGQALDRAARHWAELRPVATAARFDADVAGAFRDLSRLPGAGQLTVVAAAWQVAHRSGTALGSSIERVTELLREEAATRRVVGVELAAAHVTARMVCVLPVLVWFFAVGVGADPWHFLTATPVGIGCLVGGVLLDLSGLIWMHRIADAVLHP